MRSLLRFLSVFTILIAAALAAAPLPAPAVERYYSDWLYPALQASLTSWANQSPIALFDFIVAIGVIVIVVVLWRSVSQAVRTRHVMPALRGLLTTATVLAVVYLW